MKWCLALVVVCVLAAVGRADDDSIEYFDVGDGGIETVDSNESGDSDDLNDSDNDSLEYVDSTEVAETKPKGPLIGEISQAECICVKNKCICCSDVEITGELRDFCLEGWIESKRLAVGLDVKFSGKLIKRFEVSAQTIGKICAPIPFPPPFDEVFNLCVGNYYLNLDLDKGNAMICIYAQIAVGFPIFTVDFNCFKYENKSFSLDHSIEFEGKGLLHFDVNTLEFELNVPPEVKEFLKNEAERIVTEFKKKESLGEQVEFVAETYWRYTPLKYIIDGVQEVAPHIPGAVNYAIEEAGKAIDGFAAECSRDLAKMDRLDDKIVYMMKRLSKFTGAGILYEGYKKVSPFVESIAKFTFTQVSTAIETLVVDILKEAATIEDPLDRAAFLARKYFEYTPAGLIAKAVTPFVTSIANMAVDKITSLAEDVRDNLIANLTRMDDPVDQTYHVLKTIHKFTPVGMLLSAVEPQLDAAYAAIKNGIKDIAANAERDITTGYENAETTGDKILYVLGTVAKLSNPIGLIISLINWG